MILEAACCKEDPVAGHAARVVVAALHFVPWVALGRVMPVMHRTGDSHALLQHAFPQHVSSHLILKAIHDLVKQVANPVHVALAASVLEAPVLAREGAHQHACLALQREPAAALVDLAIGSAVGREVIAPQGFERQARLLLRDYAVQSHLISPALSKDLINLAAGA